MSSGVGLDEERGNATDVLLHDHLLLLASSRSQVLSISKSCPVRALPHRIRD